MQMLYCWRGHFLFSNDDKGVLRVGSSGRMSERSFCNGKQGINNPNRMREMVNTTKVNVFLGLFILPRQ